SDPGQKLLKAHACQFSNLPVSFFRLDHAPVSRLYQVMYLLCSLRVPGLQLLAHRQQRVGDNHAKAVKDYRLDHACSAPACFPAASSTYWNTCLLRPAYSREITGSSISRLSSATLTQRVSSTSAACSFN